jgi:hypothetical protein
MWNELQGNFQVVAGTGSGAITLPIDGRGGSSKGFILIGWWLSTITAAAQTVVIVWGGGTTTITCANRTFEKHMNHLLFTPITSITPTNFTANDAWEFDFVSRSNT